MCPLDPEIMPSPYYPLMSPSSGLVRSLKKKRLVAGYVSLRLRFQHSSINITSVDTLMSVPYPCNALPFHVLSSTEFHPT